MTLRQRLRTIACCGILQLGTLVGLPMRPEQVQDLMRSLNQPKVAQTDPEERFQGTADPVPADASQDQHPQT